MGKWLACEIEEAVFRYFDPRRNIIVPNVWCGLGFGHEIDVLVCSKNKYCTEVEIKVSLSDLKADIKKPHGHYDERLRRLYFAVPKILEKASLELIPDRAGLLVVERLENGTKIPTAIKQVRGAKINKYAKPLTEQEYIKLLQLGCMRLHHCAKNKIKCMNK